MTNSRINKDTKSSTPECPPNDSNESCALHSSASLTIESSAEIKASFSQVGFLLGWLITPLYVPIFWGILCIFDPLLRMSKIISGRLFQWMLELMNLCIITNIRLTAGTTFKIDTAENIPTDKPLLVVSNHQSMYDIPLIIWYLKRFKPKFISKKELGKGVPSISFSLRNMGSLLIDRADRAGSIRAISEWGANTSQPHQMLVIFPEGTRARDGILKSFKPGGFKVLLESMPDCYIIPLAITGSWKLLRWNLFPIPFGETVTFTVLEPETRDDRTAKELLESIETKINKHISQVPSNI